MTNKEILSNLCAYDKRNPENQSDWGEAKTPCYCDNCFYGRTELAEYILKLKEAQNESKKHDIIKR